MMPPAWSSRLALFGGALLALAVVWLLVRILWLLLGGVAVESAAPIPVPRLSQVNGISGEFRWDLFGPSLAPRLTAAPVPVADGRLRLKGVVAGDRGYAIIADPDSGEDVYRVGDPLPGGGELESIASRQVIIVRNGRRQTLALDPEAASGGPRRGNSSSRPAADASQSRPHGIRGFEGAAGASIASLPAAARSFGLDAGELGSAISVMPVAGGGFRVRPGRNARLFSELGLQINDVVVAVNGQPLESAQAVRSLFGEVMSSGEVVITVRRGEREMTLRPNLEQVMRSLQSQ